MTTPRRAHASTAGMVHHVAARGAGFLLQKECGLMRGTLDPRDAEAVASMVYASFVLGSRTGYQGIKMLWMRPYGILS